MVGAKGRNEDFDATRSTHATHRIRRTMLHVKGRTKCREPPSRVVVVMRYTATSRCCCLSSSGSKHIGPCADGIILRYRYEELTVRRDIGTIDRFLVLLEGLKGFPGCSCFAYIVDTDVSCPTSTRSNQEVLLCRVMLYTVQSDILGI